MVTAHPKTVASPGRLRPFWEADATGRIAAFADIRSRPIQFHAEGRGGPGFWSITSHEDVSAVSRHPEIFSSAQGFSLDDMPVEALELVGSIIAMDDPRHKRLRRLVNGAFTPRAIRELVAGISRTADHIIDDITTKGEFDWVPDVAMRLPLEVICDLLAVPQADRPMVLRLVDDIVGSSDPEFSGAQGGIDALMALYQYALDLGNARKADPGDDITSRLMSAEVDGESLTAAEFGSFMILLIGAGNDTTRNALSWAIELLTHHPDQKQNLIDDFDALHANAIEEVVRWSSPVLHMRRTAVEDTIIGETAIAQGDKVVIWYLPANHDPAVFDEPDAFDIARPNASRQVGFGAGGPHFCLGANLARMEMRVLLGKVLAECPHIRSTADPELLLSPFVHGVKSLPCTVRP
ncbi:cytochrome P450 [Gordonia sinesedis]